MRNKSSRTAVLSGLSCLVAASALADPPSDGPFQFEVGLNTRHFTAASEDAQVAFRSVMQPGTVSPDATSAITTSLRFTGKSIGATFFGVEGEVGEILGLTGSNVAGAYGIAGARSDLGRLRVAIELAAGRRWIRYRLDGAEDAKLTMAEPRVRADLWLTPRFTLGGAAGATIGDQPVWMAGVYIGIHAKAFDDRR